MLSQMALVLFYTKTDWGKVPTASAPGLRRD